MFKLRSEGEKPFDEIESSFTRIEEIQFAIFLILSGLFCYGFASLSRVIIELEVSSKFEYEYLIKPDFRLILLISIFIGFVYSILVVYSLTKLYLKNWDDFLIYGMEKYYPWYWSFLKAFSKGLLVLSLLAFILALDWYTVFDQDKIIVNDYFSTESRTYSYSDIKKINEHDKRIAPNGNIADRPCFVITFLDDEIWDSSESGYSDHEENRALIEFVIAKSNKELEYSEYKSN